MLRKLPLLLLGFAWTLFAFSGGWFTHAMVGERVVNSIKNALAQTAPTPGDVVQITNEVAPTPPPTSATESPTKNNPTGKPVLLLDEAWAKVKDTFVGTVPDETQRNQAAIRGALSLLNDKYTTFLDPKARQAEKDNYRGKFGGIGVNLNTNSDGKIWLLPRKNTPAIRAGVQANDILIAVDDVLLPEKPDSNEIVHRVRGDPGTKVKITVRRGEQTLNFEISREIIEIPSVEGKLITDTAKTNLPIGYIQIYQFTEPTAKEAKKVIEELKFAGAKGYILDLRNNGGGLVLQSVEVASQFLSDGLVLIEKTKDKEGTYPVVKGGLITDPKIPVVVLVNGNTASAAEILAGALQDRGRAKLIGEKTFGKGSMQWLFDLSDGSSVHVTFAKWFMPSRKAIEGVGIMPDTVIVRDKDEVIKGLDSQLDAALSFFNTNK